jgi:hypothetical protein
VLSSILLFLSRAKIIRSFEFCSVIKKDKLILKIPKKIKFQIPKTLKEGINTKAAERKKITTENTKFFKYSKFNKNTKLTKLCGLRLYKQNLNI